MTFFEWFVKTGLTMHALAKLAGLSPTIIKNLIFGKPVTFRTVKKLVRIGKNFPTPLAFEMFPKVYIHGIHKMVSGPMAFKNALRKKLKKGAFYTP